GEVRADGEEEERGREDRRAREHGRGERGSQEQAHERERVGARRPGGSGVHRGHFTPRRASCPDQESNPKLVGNGIAVAEATVRLRSPTGWSSLASGSLRETCARCAPASPAC